MEGIEVQEINNTDPNNTKESYFIPDNEKNNKEINVGNMEVRNYEGKSSKKILKVLTFVLTLGNAGLLGGSLLSNAFVGKEPTLANISFKRNSNSIEYSFDIKEIGTLDVSLTLKRDEEILHQESFTEKGSYQGIVQAIGEEELIVTLASTNDVDYWKTLYEETL